MNSLGFNQQHQHYTLVAEAIAFLTENRLRQPSLAELSTHLNLSEFHLQRVFSQWAGISPKQFLQWLTKQDAKARLNTASNYSVALDVGLSSGSRLHDLFVTHESMTPDQYRNCGDGLKIEYGQALSPFGLCFIATTERGICKLAFFDNAFEYADFKSELVAEWSNSKLFENHAIAVDLVAKIFGSVSDVSDKSLRLLIKGTVFQLKVWEALLAIPSGNICSYAALASHIGKPTGARAVASAIAKNKIGYLIPCHRVIRESGEFSQYRWGKTRKITLLAKEYFDFDSQSK